MLNSSILTKSLPRTPEKKEKATGVHVAPHKCHRLYEKPVFNSLEKKKLLLQKTPNLDLEYGPLKREFVCPNQIPVCTRCGETDHTKAICLLYQTKVCKNCVKGTCEFDPCWFSKDEASVRLPLRDMCIRVRMSVFPDRDGIVWKRVKVYGCGQYDHRYRDCPVRKEFATII